MSQNGTSSGTLVVPVETVLYYYGNISRETAEWILWDRGCQDGMYLLRESNADFVLSLCFQKSVLHYRIKKLLSGDVGLCGVAHQVFRGPVELVEGVEGLACKPTIPCNKSLDAILPLTHWGLTQENIRQAVLIKGHEWGLNEAELMLSMSEDHNDVKHLMIKTLHTIQPWFHGHLSRAEAEKRLLESGHKDGKFLVRERDDSSYAFCLSHSGRIKHYKIDVLPSGEFAIQDGQRFPSIMALVSHYSLFSDGLWCALTEPCPRSVPKRDPSPIARAPQDPRPPIPLPDIPVNQLNPVVISRTSPVPVDPPSRAKIPNGRHSPGVLGSPSWLPKGSKLTNNQKGLFTKLVQSVSSSNSSSSSVACHSESSSPSRELGPSPSSSCPIPSNSSPARDSSSKPTVPVLQPTAVVTAPSTGTPPPHNRKPSGTFSPTMREEERKNRCMQKASSFDLIPAFFSALFSSGDVESEIRRPRKRISDVGPTPYRKGSLANENQKDCNGYRSEFYVDIDKQDSSQNSSPSTASPPVPSPCLSSQRKGLEATINYANKDIFSIRSSSLGDASEEVPSKWIGEAPSSTCGSPSSFIRSASSPSVVSQGGTKPKPPLPPRPPHLISTSLEEEERSNNHDEGLQNETSTEFGPPPPPRRKALKKSHEEHVISQQVNGVRSPDRSSTTSPLLTEDSLSVPCSPLSESSRYADLNKEATLEEKGEADLLISFDSPPPLPPDHPCWNEAHNLSASSSPTIPNGGSLLTDELIEKPDPTYATLSGDTRLLANAFTDDALVEEQQQESGETLPVFSREESELAYQTLRRCRRGPVNLDPNAIVLKDKIGSGNFGEVWCGAFSSGSVEVQFAVKMLKSSVAHQKSEILDEAQTMAALDHPHIVRLIGVCEGDPFMLVMELAPLGPLNKYLKNHKDMSFESILMLLVQVAWAMEYLESQQYVHRDLAARNVLLVNESFAKISDFGMSRALGLGKEYYKAETAGKWPLKWYAPECIYYFKFSTKSDIWSFGVTMWEALSHGAKPYQGMAGRDILQMFDRNQRLLKPEGCPDEIYDIMWSCWRYRPELRPDFAEVHHRLQQFASICER